MVETQIPFLGSRSESGPQPKPITGVAELKKSAGDAKTSFFFRIFFSVLAVLGPGMGPGRPDFARFRVLASNFCTGNRPGPVRGLFFFFWDWPDPEICQFSEFSCTEYSESLDRSEGMDSTPMAMVVI